MFLIINDRFAADAACRFYDAIKKFNWEASLGTNITHSVSNPHLIRDGNFSFQKLVDQKIIRR